MSVSTTSEAAQASAARQSWPLDSTSCRARALRARAVVGADPHLAAAVGLAPPVAYTGAVHRAVIAWSQATKAGKRYPTGQGEIAEERDVLFMAAAALRREERADAVAFTLYAVPAAGPETLPVVFDLVALSAPGERGQAVVAIASATEHQPLANERAVRREDGTARR